MDAAEFRHWCQAIHAAPTERALLQLYLALLTVPSGPAQTALVARWVVCSNARVDEWVTLGDALPDSAPRVAGTVPEMLRRIEQGYWRYAAQQRRLGRAERRVQQVLADSEPRLARTWPRPGQAAPP